MHFNWSISIGDVLTAGSFFFAAIFFVYDRLKLVKRHDDIIKSLQETIAKLDNQLKALSNAIETLSREFQTYKDQHTLPKRKRGII